VLVERQRQPHSTANAESCTSDVGSEEYLTLLNDRPRRTVTSSSFHQTCDDSKLFDSHRTVGRGTNVMSSLGTIVNGEGV
jgi:hypothetical protein